MSSITILYGKLQFSLEQVKSCSAFVFSSSWLLINYSLLISPFPWKLRAKGEHMSITLQVIWSSSNKTRWGISEKMLMENISCKVLDKISASFVPLGLTRHGFLKTHHVLLWLIQLLIFNNLCPYKLITFLKHACMHACVCGYVYV